MDQQQVAVLFLSALVCAMFTVEMIGSLRDYVAPSKNDRRRPRWAIRFREVVKSFVIWIGVTSIFAGRIVVTFVPDPDGRRVYGLVAGALISGALLLGGAFLAWTRIVDRDEIVA